MPTPTTVPPFRTLTTNVAYTMSAEDKLADYKAAARDGDLVFVQEVQTHERHLIREAFPKADWLVYFGNRANGSPVIARRALFARVSARAVKVHDGMAKVIPNRYATILHLRHRTSGVEFEALNTHLIPGAWNNKVTADDPMRQRMWGEGIAIIKDLIAAAGQAGLPVIGGGDYNRQLQRHPALGKRVGGRKVTYHVPGTSIDLLYTVNAKGGGWAVTDTDTLKRRSDHHARRAVVSLTARAPKPTKPVKPVKPAGIKWPADRYARTTHGGKPVDYYTKAALMAAEAELGYELTVVQGSYNAGGVSASAGTHDGGGAVDLLAWDHERKVKALRRAGFAAWYRHTRPGLWNAHIHAIQMGNARLSSGAAAQVAAYRAGRDGLAGNRVDRTWRPATITPFVYPPKA